MFTDFECLHNLLVLKFDQVPFLPCRVLLALRDEERKERQKLLETYLNICVRHQEILNSLELRLFLDLENRLQVYMNPVTCIRDFELEGLFLCSCCYFSI